MNHKTCSRSGMEAEKMASKIKKGTNQVYVAGIRKWRKWNKYVVSVHNAIWCQVVLEQM